VFDGLERIIAAIFTFWVVVAAIGGYLLGRFLL
jgi:hypothetical protein